MSIPLTSLSPVMFVSAPMSNTKISGVRSRTLRWLVAATKSVTHCYILVTLNINIRLFIPVTTVLVRTILPFIIVLNQDSLLILFYLYIIILLLLLFKGVGKGGRDKTKGDLRPIHGTEDFRHWKMSSW